MSQTRAKPMFYRLFWTLLGLSLLALLISGWIFLRMQKTTSLENTSTLLHIQARLIAQMAGTLSPAQNIDDFTKQISQKTGSRVTVIALDGRVLGDSEADPATMDNHAGRPEVMQALAKGEGQRVRHSRTLGIEFLYVAIPATIGTGTPGVIRVATPLLDIYQAINVQRREIVIALILIGLAAICCCVLFARYLCTPLASCRHAAVRLGEGDLSSRIYVDGPAEIEDVALAMNQMAANLQEMLATVEYQKQELETMVSCMADGVIVIDEGQHIRLINETACEMFRLDRATAIGKPVYELMRYAEIVRLVERILEVESSFEDEVEMRGPLALNFIARCARLRGVDGAATGALLLLHDQTPEHRLRKMGKHFIENASQELGTPVSALKGYIAFLLEGAPKDITQVRQVLGKANAHVRRLEDLTDDLQTLAALEKANALPETRTVPLQNVLHNAADYVMPYADALQIQIEIDCASDLIATLDVSLMSKALIQLLDNALRYAPAESAVKITGTKSKAGRIEIRVRDAGEGIAENHLPYIFDRFYRVEKTNSQRPSGTGLGLAIVKYIVQLHEGSVAVESMPGMGSTFIIELKEALS